MSVAQHEVECVIIGAGVIGLAIARHFALHKHEVIIIDAENTFGTGISSRNSEVIHAGIYYPKDSLKANLCVKGKSMLYEYCQLKEIPHSKIGKLIVAKNKEEHNTLSDLKEKAKNNGVHDLYYLTESEIKNLEPELSVYSALFSPSTGIIDSHALMQQLLADAEANGAWFLKESRLISGEVQNINGAVQNKSSLIQNKNGATQTQKQKQKQTQHQGITLTIQSVDGMHTVFAHKVINAAGLNATSIPHLIDGFPKHLIPKPYFCKGNYFTLKQKISKNQTSPFKHLIYPVPNNAGLGVHVTLDLAGQTRFGPDTEWISSSFIHEHDYEVSPNQHKFYQAIQTYWSSLREEDLIPGYVGIRPKISGPNEKPADFMIECVKSHGISGLVNLYGIESPGLTASLAIAEYVYTNCEI